MPIEEPVPAAQPIDQGDRPNDERRRRLVLAAWVSAALATLLVLLLLLIVDVTAIWAIGGMMHIGSTPTWVAAGLTAAGCVWIAVRFFWRVLQSELEMTLRKG